VQIVREGDNGASIELSNEEALRAENAKRELRRDEAASFVATILELAGQRELPVYVVITMRSDFLGDCDTFHGLPETINETFYLVPRLTRQQRMEVIEKPIRLYGQDITSRLLDLVTNDVGDESDQLPVMQHALMRTWEKWKQNDGGNKSIDLPDYEAAEMISGALSKDAEIALSELNDDERTIAKRMFQALVETDAQGRNVRRPARLTQLAGIADVAPGKVLEVIDHFRRDGRCFLMLTSERVEDDPLVDISHESLIRQWDQLGKWVRSENYSKDQYTRVAAAALRHTADKGSLIAGTDLQLAVDWWESRKPNEAWSLRYNRDFRTAEKFLSESKTQSDKEKAETERQRLRELETERVQRQNKKLRRMMYALGFISVFALFGVVGTGTATRQALTSFNSAETARKKAEKATEEATRQTNYSLLEKARADRETNIARDLAGRADRARVEAERQAGIAAMQTLRANRALQLLEIATERNQQELIRRRRALVDELGTKYQRALSLAASPNTIEEAALTYEDILGIYETEQARGGTLSTLLVLGRLFDGTLRKDADAQRALDYYERALPLFNVDNAAEREKKTASLTKMGELLLDAKRAEEARQRFEEALSLGYQPALDENISVYRRLADLYYKLPGVENLEQARVYNESELAHLDRRINATPNSPANGNKLTTLIKLGTINMRLGNEKEAKEKYEQAIEVATSSLDQEPFEPLIKIGESLDRPAEKQTREHYFKRAFESVKEGPADVKADTYKKLGDAHNRLKEYREALPYLQQTEALYNQKSSKMAYTYRSIGLSYEGLGDKEKALEYYRRAQTLFLALRMSPIASAVGVQIRRLEEK
jgi:tetratricopeptide (TPR) repeat protein